MKNDELYLKANKRAKALQNIDEEYISHLSIEEVKASLIDLSVYKIELEMQNDELTKIQQELYKTKEYYVSLFEQAPIGYAILNVSSEIKSINRWLIDFLKIDKPTVLGKKISDFVFHEDQDSFYFLIRDTLKYKKFSQIEVRIGSQEHGYYWCLVDCKMIGNNENEIFLSFVDIHYKVLAERVLLEEKSRADNVNYAKSQFLANMSHEIRTPMNGILGVLQLLEFTGLEVEQLELVEISKKSAFSLVNILNSILDYSKIEEKMVLFECLEFRVSDIIDEVKSLFYPSIKDKNLSLYSNIDRSVPITLRGDAFRIKQILNNLVGNAIKFTAFGEIKIIVDVLERSNQNNVVIEFQIHDTGIGISEEALEFVFERFSQADSSNSRKYGGTGLGLAICKGLAEQMGGSIRIESLKGKGTIVKFRVPLEIGEQLNIQKETEYDMQNEQVGTYANKSIELLIVEDDEVSRLILNRLASRKGWYSESFPNGLEAVKRFEEKQFDIVIMDVQMPVLDGYKATALIRELEQWSGSKTPIIGLTANALSGDREKCIQAGMDDYMSKPLNVSDFYQMVHKWVGITF